MRATWIALIGMLLGWAAVAQVPASPPQSAGAAATLKSVGEYAENVYDAARDEKWDDAAAKLATLKAAAQGIPAQANKALVTQIQNSIKQMDVTVPVKDQVRTMREANLITRDAAELGTNLHEQIPLGVTYLDFYGRQLEIASRTGDMARLKSTTNDLAATWQKLRPAVMQHSGNDEAEQWDKLVQQIQSADKASDYKKLAEDELEEVDRLENLFQNSSAAKQ
jgi:hypothetical protein